MFKKKEIKAYICMFILGLGIGLMIRPIIGIAGNIEIDSKYPEDTDCELLIDSRLHDEFNMKKHTGLTVRDTISLHSNLCILVVNKELSYNKYASVNNLSLWSEDELQKDDYSYYVGEKLFYDKLRMDDNHLYYIASELVLGTYCISDLTVISSDFYVSSSSIYVSYLIKTEAGEVIGIVFFEL